MSKNQLNAALIIIGNEILSGRTPDKNINFLATELNKIGIHLKEVRVIPDEVEVIIDAVNKLRHQFEYVFTTGGIGPTHDDITSASIAKALGLPLVLDEEAERRLREHHGKKLNAARLKMAEIPEGATLIDNPISAAPGFRIENVFVLAGVPAILQVMFDHLKTMIDQGKPMISYENTVYIAEGTIAERLDLLQQEFDDVEIGSYPFFRQNRLGTCIVLRCSEKETLKKAQQGLESLVAEFDSEIVALRKQ